MAWAAASISRRTENVNARLQVNYFQTRLDGVGINQVRFGVGISFASKLK